MTNTKTAAIAATAAFYAAVLLFSPAPSSGQTAAPLENHIPQPRILRNVTSGHLVGWGSDYQEHVTTPLAGNDYVAISQGFGNGFAIRSDGSIVGWGDNNGGQTNVPAGNNYVAIAAGNGCGVALKSDGSIVGWGYNNFGQINVPAGNNYVAIAPGQSLSFALTLDGRIVAWGDNIGSWLNTTPTDSNYVAIAAGGWNGLALKSDGSIVGWGYNSSGQIDVPAGNNYVAIAAGFNYGIALKSDGSIVGWGNKDRGQIDVPVGNDFTAISGGSYAGLALSKYAAWISRISSKTRKPGKPAKIFGRGFVATTNQKFNRVYFSTGHWPDTITYQAKLKSASIGHLVIIIPPKCHSGVIYNVSAAVKGQTSNMVPFLVK